MGNYLILLQQPSAALAAVDHSLELIQQLRASSEVRIPGGIDRLELNLRINRAIFLNLDTQYEMAHAELRNIEAKYAVTEFQELALYWARAIASIGLDRGEEAYDQLLEDQATISIRFNSDPDPLYAYDYPQYFDERKRLGIFGLLRGEALLSAGSVELGISELEMSIEQDPELWDARFSYANALYGLGHFSAAQAEMSDINEKLPRGLLYSRELLYFNHGLVLLAMDRYEDAVSLFDEAIDNARDRQEYFVSDIMELLPSQISERVSFASVDRISLEAGNNLAVALLGIAYTPGAEAIEARRRALSAFEGLIELNPEVAWFNIARAYWSFQNYGEFAVSLRRAMNSSVDQTAMANAFLTLFLEAEDDEASFEGVNALLNELNVQRIDDPLKSRLQDLMLSAEVIFPENYATQLQQQIAALSL
jgi:tetratricopeptide (TPR) repeat protein